VGEYVGMIVGKLCRDKHMSRDLTPTQQWF